MHYLDKLYNPIVVSLGTIKVKDEKSESIMKDFKNVLNEYDLLKSIQEPEKDGSLHITFTTDGAAPNKAAVKLFSYARNHLIC